jgi:phage tail-like protein
VSFVPRIRAAGPAAARILDPIAGHNFFISLIEEPLAGGGGLETAHAITQSLILATEGLLVAGFSECTGLELSMEPVTWKAGGDDIHKFPAQVAFANIVLKRGVALSDDLFNWHLSFADGRGRRRSGLIMLQDDFKIPRRLWLFLHGIPVQYVGPAMSAGSSATAIEELHIAHQRLESLSIGKLGISL